MVVIGVTQLPATIANSRGDVEVETKSAATCNLIWTESVRNSRTDVQSEMFRKDGIIHDDIMNDSSGTKTARQSMHLRPFASLAFGALTNAKVAEVARTITPAPARRVANTHKSTRHASFLRPVWLLGWRGVFVIGQ